MKSTGPALFRTNRRTGAPCSFACLLVLISLIYPSCIWTLVELGGWSHRQHQAAKVQRHAGDEKVVSKGREERIQPSEVDFGQELFGVVVGMNGAGAFLDINCVLPGWLPIGRIREEHVENVEDVTDIGHVMKVRVVGLKSGFVDVTAIDLPIFSKRPLSDLEIGEVVEGRVLSKKNGKIGRTKGKAILFLDIEATANAAMLVDPKHAKQVVIGRKMKAKVIEIREPFQIFVEPVEDVRPIIDF
eukprot:TRINITY_DN9567_c0_g1_i1.p1 TRINITY_DN9567_c0_g1~~TRINITY_DN9567_c0_g1_i1.p1  ORF type:complete len:257 (+),score=34.83 TRINITY_DN9567_c0_g1_i1:40-771(+)